MARSLVFTLLLAIGIGTRSRVAGQVSNFAVIISPSGLKYRVQALSATLVRVEVQGPSGAFEDRPTFLAVNRSWPGLTVKASGDPHHVTVTSVNYTITFDFTPKEATDVSPVGKNSCTVREKGRDAVCGASKCIWSRTPQYPDGNMTENADACCNLCNADINCKFWVWAVDSRVCFPLHNVTGTKPGAGRIFGGVKQLPPVTPSPKPAHVDGKITILDGNGNLLWEGSLDLSKVSSKPALPDPSAMPAVWPIRDAPRFVPPAWGRHPTP